MRHHKIPKSGKHKKLKVVSASNWSDNEEEEDNQQPKRRNDHSGNPSKLKEKNIKEKRTKEKNKLIQSVPRRVKELFEVTSLRTKKKKNKFKNEPGLLSKLDAFDSDVEEGQNSCKPPAEDESGAERGIKLRPGSIKQGPYETNRQFMRRLEKLASNAKFEAVIEERFDVDLCPKMPGLPRKPQVLSTVDGSVYDESKERKRKSIKGDPKSDESLIPNKILKRRLRDHKRRLKKKGIKRPVSGTTKSGLESDLDDIPDSDGPDFDDYVDHVHFGEVAQRPPSLGKFKKLKTRS